MKALAIAKTGFQCEKAFKRCCWPDATKKRWKEAMQVE
jgi:hypothetical protein